MLKSIRLSIRLRCAKIGLNKEHVDTRINVSLHMVRRSYQVRRILKRRTINPNNANSIMKDTSVLMEQDVSLFMRLEHLKSCINTTMLG